MLQNIKTILNNLGTFNLEFLGSDYSLLLVHLLFTVKLLFYSAMYFENKSTSTTHFSHLTHWKDIAMPWKYKFYNFTYWHLKSLNNFQHSKITSRRESDGGRLELVPQHSSSVVWSSLSKRQREEIPVLDFIFAPNAIMLFRVLNT